LWRALVLLLVTAVLPGAGQVVGGNRRLGRAALAAWLVIIGTMVLTCVVVVLDRGLAVSLLTRPPVLVALSVGCFAGALAWPVLVVDAWRLARVDLLPRRLRRRLTAVVVVLVLVTSVPLVAVGRRVWAAAELVDGLFGSGTRTEAVDGRYTVLLLGGDSGPNRIGLRPDSITLASIEQDSGRVTLFALPRNLENVPFARGTLARRAMPRGWSCGDNCLLNGLYTWGHRHPEYFPGARDPGAEAMKQAVAGVLDLPVNYYVLIDLHGFRRLVDAMGGIDVVVGAPVPIGGGTSPVRGYIRPGRRHLDGFHALWFARSRHGSIDYARMARQRCVMTAMLDQLEPQTVLTRFQKIAGASRDVVSTDIPASRLSTFVDLAGRAKGQRVTSVQFVPPLIRPAYPDYRRIRSRVDEALDRAGDPAPPASGRSAAGRPATGTGERQGRSGAEATVARGAEADARDVCRAG
jgi:LCP family protein required for cell wall assembly